ncbi:hypothetical protein Tco_0108205 [Tanacetum coccineum]
MQSCGRSSYARAMIELQADVELKDTIIVAIPKLIGEGFYMRTIRVEYELKPLRIELKAGSNDRSTFLYTSVARFQGSSLSQLDPESNVENQLFCHYVDF